LLKKWSAKIWSIKIRSAKILVDENLVGKKPRSAKQKVAKILYNPDFSQTRFDDDMIQICVRMILREIENFRSWWESPNIIDFYGLCLYDGAALLCIELMDIVKKSIYDHS
jgi:hypothetical protein